MEKIYAKNIKEINKHARINERVVKEEVWAIE